MISENKNILNTTNCETERYTEACEDQNERGRAETMTILITSGVLLYGDLKYQEQTVDDQHQKANQGPARTTCPQRRLSSTTPSPLNHRSSHIAGSVLKKQAFQEGYWRIF